MNYINSNLTVIGNIAIDHVKYEIRSLEPFWSGAGLNVSLGASKFGLYPKLLSVVGSDALVLLSRIKDIVDISDIRIADGKTCRFYIKYSSDGSLESIYCEFGVSNLINSYLKSIKLSTGHFHICCRAPLKSNLILQKLVQGNIPFSLDFIKSCAFEQIFLVRDWLAYAEFIFVNTQEFQLMQQLKINLGSIKKLIITAGSSPVKVMEFGQEIACIPCSEINFYDVTGAGDFFTGSFLANYLSGKSLSTSLEKAIQQAQASLHGLGVWC